MRRRAGLDLEEFQAYWSEQHGPLVAGHAHTIGLRRYRSGISYGPVVLFIGVAAVWIVGFPWYLVVRDRILRGEATLKEAGTA